MNPLLMEEDMLTRLLQISIDRKRLYKGTKEFKDERYRVIAFTDTGLVGLVPLGTQSGDTVCMFEGLDLPFIIRDSPESRADYKTFVLYRYADFLVLKWGDIAERAETITLV